MIQQHWIINDSDLIVRCLGYSIHFQYFHSSSYPTVVFGILSLARFTNKYIKVITKLVVKKAGTGDNGEEIKEKVIDL